MFVSDIDLPLPPQVIASRYPFRCVPNSVRDAPQRSVEDRYAAHSTYPSSPLAAASNPEMQNEVWRISLVSMRSAEALRLRNFGTEHPFSYRYELQLHHRLESAANMHTAADLHIHSKFSNRADLESRECREQQRNTRPSNSRNGFWLGDAWRKWRRHMHAVVRSFRCEDNVLNLRADSKRSHECHSAGRLSKIF